MFNYQGLKGLSPVNKEKENTSTDLPELGVENDRL